MSISRNRRTNHAITIGTAIIRHLFPIHLISVSLSLYRFFFSLSLSLSHTLIDIEMWPSFFLHHNCKRFVLLLLLLSSHRKPNFLFTSNQALTIALCVDMQLILFDRIHFTKQSFDVKRSFYRWMKFIELQYTETEVAL